MRSLNYRIQTQINALGRALSGGKKYSSLEINRLSQDLQASRRRLKSREYRQSSFKSRSTMSTPERTAEIASDLNFYWSVAKIWQSIIKNYSVDQKVSVAELGSGHISKVGLALIYSEFCGSLTLMDQDSAATARAMECLEYFGSKFICSGLNCCLHENSKKFDALLANHFTDDLILSYFCKLQKIDIAKLYTDERKYTSVWQSILKDPSFLDDLICQFAQSLIRSLNPGAIILLLDYPSFSHKALSLLAVADLVTEFKMKLSRELLKLSLHKLKDMNSDLTYGRLTVTKHMLSAFVKKEEANAAR